MFSPPSPPTPPACPPTARACFPELVLCALLGYAGLSGSAHAAPAKGGATPCTAHTRLLDGQIARPASATRVCSGERFRTYQKEVSRYRDLSLHFEIWSAALKDASAFDNHLRHHLGVLGYRLTDTFPNGETKYASAKGRGTRISTWNVSGRKYWMLFLY